jgi:predicted Zn-dependent protease
LAELAAATGQPANARAWAEHTARLAPGFKPAKQFLKALRSPAGKSSIAKLGEFPVPDTQAAPRLSVCLIVRNEEKFLPGCLRSLQGAASQIVVVDTGSTDRTVEIARSFGAEIFSTPWTDDFGAARNTALEHARGDWVLILDADEELAPGAAEKLARALRVPGVMAYRLPIVDAGREEEGCSYVPRLFRNAPGLFYVGRIHEQVFSSVEIRREEWGLENRLGDVTLLHHGYTAEVTRDRDKVARNLRLLERAVEEMPNEPNLLMNFGLELVRAGQLEAGLVHYREACQTLAALPANQIVPELRETLLTQMATHLMAAKQHEEIVQLLRSPLARLTPITASLHFVLGLALMELRHPLDAAEQFKACLQKRNQAALSPVNKDIRKAGPRHCLALCLAQLKRLPEAEAVFQEALMDDPHSRPMRFDYARLLHEQGRALDAIKLLHQLVTERADDLLVWQLGGQIALSQPQFREFADDWTREARQHFPQDDLLRQQQGEALLLNQKPGEALPILRALENGAAHRTTAAAILGELLVHEGPNTRAMLNEPAVSQEFLQWYRRLLKSNASEAVQTVNEQLDLLDTVLPSATRVLRQAVQASNEPAR